MALWIVGVYGSSCDTNALGMYLIMMFSNEVLSFGGFSISSRKALVIIGGIFWFCFSAFKNGFILWNPSIRSPCSSLSLIWVIIVGSRKDSIKSWCTSFRWFQYKASEYNTVPHLLTLQVRPVCACLQWYSVDCSPSTVSQR